MKFKINSTLHIYMNKYFGLTFIPFFVGRTEILALSKYVCRIHLRTAGSLAI